jgi:hypothetical protein
MSEYTFNLNKPPLISDQGVDYIIQHPIVRGEMLRYTTVVGLMDVNNIYNKYPAVIYRQFRWVRINEPHFENTTTEVHIEEKFTSSVSNLNQYKKLVKASMGGDFGLIKNEVDLEIEETITKEESWESTKSELKITLVEKDTWYTRWQLECKNTVIVTIAFSETHNVEVNSDYYTVLAFYGDREEVMS